VVSYAIRRCEFDDFLLRRSGARLLEGLSVESLRHRGDAWVVNDSIETRVVVGAGGHICPVARFMRGGVDYTAYDESRYAAVEIAGEISWVEQVPNSAPPPPPPPPTASAATLSQSLHEHCQRWNVLGD
jgi:hypothetical protein